jgi:hypothetical protein
MVAPVFYFAPAVRGCQNLVDTAIVGYMVVIHWVRFMIRTVHATTMVISPIIKNIAEPNLYDFNFLDSLEPIHYCYGRRHKDYYKQRHPWRIACHIRDLYWHGRTLYCHSHIGRNVSTSSRFFRRPNSFVVREQRCR